MSKKTLFLAAALLASIFLSGCVGSTAWPGLASSGDVAYLANTSAVHAIDPKNGAELWSFAGEKGGFSFFNTNPSLFVTTPLVTDDGLVIIVDSGNKHVLYAVDPNDVQDGTPAIEWKFTEAKGHWIATPLIVDNRLFAPNSDGNIYVLDLQDNQSVKTAIKVIEPFVQFNDGKAGRLWSQPASDGKYLFMTSLDHSVFAVDLQTYEIVWHEDLGGAIPGGIAIGSDGMVYVGSFAKQLERFDPATGAHEPVLDTKGWIWGTPVVDGDNLYFSDVDGYFYSYNVKEAKLNWEPIKPDSAITASALVQGDKVLIATESGEVYAVDATGKSDIWYTARDEDGKAYTTPVHAGDYVLVAYLESDYYLVALDNEGDEKWTYPSQK